MEYTLNPMNYTNKWNTSTVDESTESTTNPPWYTSPSLNTALQVYMVIVMTVGTFGNTITITAIVKKKDLRTIPNFYILNLAIADLGVCLLVPPIAFASFTDAPSDWLCEIAAYLGLVFLMMSVLNLGIIAFNRYILICHPYDIYSRIFTIRNVKISIIGMWIYVLADLSPPFFGFGSYGFNPFFGGCSFSGESSLTYYFILSMLDLTLIFPSLILTLIFYIAVFVKFHHSRRALAPALPQNQNGTIQSTSESNIGQSPTSHIKPETNLKVGIRYYIL